MAEVAVVGADTPRAYLGGVLPPQSEPRGIGGQDRAGPVDHHDALRQLPQYFRGEIALREEGNRLHGVQQERGCLGQALEVVAVEGGSRGVPSEDERSADRAVARECRCKGPRARWDEG